MAEPVRLVVWDLDETFWRGTLVEGGIREYVQAHHEIVVELARRVSSARSARRTRSKALSKSSRNERSWTTSCFPTSPQMRKGPEVGGAD